MDGERRFLGLGGGVLVQEGGQREKGRARMRRRRERNPLGQGRGR